MASVLEKLSSVDSDIRFMGLEDLDESLNENVAPEVVQKVVSLVGDSYYPVQRRAASVVSSLAKYIAPELLTQELLNAGLPQQQAGLALKAVFKNTMMPINFTLPLREHVAVFRISEGCDAVYEYLVKKFTGRAISASEAEDITDFYLLEYGVPTFSRAFDLLALCIPYIDPQKCEKDVVPALDFEKHPAYLGILGKCTDIEWARSLAPAIEKIALDVTDEYSTEHALRILAAFAPKKDYSRLAERFMTYLLDSANDEHSDQSLEDSFEDAFYEENEDFSAPIRRASAQLAAATGDTGLIAPLLDALAQEPVDLTRSAIYSALKTLCTDFDGAVLKKEVAKDIASRAEARVDGVALFMHFHKFEDAAELIRTDIEKNGSASMAAITQLVPVVPEAAPVFQSLLTAAKVPEKVFSGIQQLSLTSLLPDVLKVNTPLALLCAAALTSADDLSTVDSISQRLLQIFDSDLETALKALDTLPVTPQTACAAELARKIADSLRRSQVPAGEVEHAYDLQFKLAYAPDVEAILNYRDGDTKLKAHVFWKNIPKSITPAVFKWAAACEMYDLVTEMARHDSRVLAWAFETLSSPRLHVAVIVATNDKEVSDVYYKFSATDFADLGPNQLEFLKLLSKGGNSIERYYTVNQMIAALSSIQSVEPVAELLGEQIALTGNTDALGAIEDDETRRSVVQVYANSIEDPEAAFEILKHNRWLREKFGARCIRNGDSARRFAEIFESDPQFVLHTARHLDTSVAAGMSAVLTRLARGEMDRQEEPEATRDIRAQAMSILRFTEPVNRLLATINFVLKPNPELVKIAMIGPFKMKVDELDPAREEAVDGLMRCTTRDTDPELLKEAVHDVVQYRLEDNSAKTRLLAYRWLTHLLELDYARHLVLEHTEELRKLIEKQVTAPIKSNAVTWVVQEAKDLQLAAEELRLEL